MRASGRDGSPPPARVAAGLSSLAAHLPTPLRRRLGRIKRSLLGNPRFAEWVAGSSQSPGPRQDPLKAGAVTTPAPTRLQIRRDFVFRTADQAGAALEIGPAHDAILPKRDGVNPKTVDYLDPRGHGRQ